jgi:hypothetical protein
MQVKQKLYADQIWISATILGRHPPQILNLIELLSAVVEAEALRRMDIYPSQRFRKSYLGVRSLGTLDSAWGPDRTWQFIARHSRNIIFKNIGTVLLFSLDQLIVFLSTNRNQTTGNSMWNFLN